MVDAHRPFSVTLSEDVCRMVAILPRRMVHRYAPMDSLHRVRPKLPCAAPVMTATLPAKRPGKIIVASRRPPG